MRSRNQIFACQSIPGRLLFVVGFRLPRISYEPALLTSPSPRSSELLAAQVIPVASPKFRIMFTPLALVQLASLDGHPAIHVCRGG